MPASFDGNDGNDGNAANAGGGGNSSSTSAGWFFADRVNLPFVTVLDTTPQPPRTVAANQPIAKLRIDIPHFPDRNWSAEWYSWLALLDFAQTPGWNAIPATQPNWPAFAPANGDWSTVNSGLIVQKEIDDLVTAAQNERADALSEILSQSDEFISYFLNLMTARPGAYPHTTKVLGIASLVGTFVVMYYKGLYRRPRPSQLCPALLPPIEVPGHASFPSGHSTQAHLMALCMNDVLSGLPQQATIVDDLWTLADRIARNREIAGLHYASDTAAGVCLAQGIMPLLNTPLAGNQTRYQLARDSAAKEWQ